jgi:hypothetical protein
MNERLNELVANPASGLRYSSLAAKMTSAIAIFENKGVPPEILRLLRQAFAMGALAGMERHDAVGYEMSRDEINAILLDVIGH